MKDWSTLKRMIWLKGSGSTAIDDGYRTMTGDIIQFKAKESAAFRKLQVALEPQQNLNGYDSPWPAGGGKNLFNFDNLTLSKVSISGTADDFTITGTDASYNRAVYDCTAFAGKTVYVSAKGTRTGSSSNNTFLAAQYTLNGTTYNSGAMTGQKSYNSSGVSNTVDAVLQFPEGVSAAKLFIYVNNESSGGVGLTSRVEGLRICAAQNEPWVPYSNICPITGHSGANVYVKAAYDASATATVSVTFPNDPGTVYGGSYDFVSGKLTVDRAIQDIGDRWWTYDSAGNRFSVAFNDAPVIAGWNKIDIRCSCYRTGPVATDSGTDMTVGIWNKYVYIRDSSCTSTAELRTARAGQKIVYQLATPLVYDLTPQAISSLVGTNVVWSDGVLTIEAKGRKV